MRVSVALRLSMRLPVTAPMRAAAPPTPMAAHPPISMALMPSLALRSAADISGGTKRTVIELPRSTLTWRSTFRCPSEAVNTCRPGPSSSCAPVLARSVR